jgi:tRNA (guanine37-N1)-methyltransferase
MLFRLFSLYPNLFNSFESESLIARAIARNIISIEKINWREKYGKGNYNQVDDRPYGGGSGMVLQIDPIYQALKDYGAISPLFSSPSHPISYSRVIPNNHDFYNHWQNTNISNVTISMTPRGFSFNQQIAQWLSGFTQINIVCGRFEGFDARLSECVDLEISMGDFVSNGGEVPAMLMIESVARLVDGFVTKPSSVEHESFSASLNSYSEYSQFIKSSQTVATKPLLSNLFDNQNWLRSQLPRLEHPQFSRPKIWHNHQVPELLLAGDHKQIHNWRNKWYAD